MMILLNSRRHKNLLLHTKVKPINKRHDFFGRQRHEKSVQSKLNMLIDESKIAKTIKTLLKLYAKDLICSGKTQRA